jgi:large subunit ribosomal protein L21
LKPFSAPSHLRRTQIYAIVRAGGRQYRIEPDQLLDVDLLSAEVGSTVELTDVLLLSGNGDVRVGTPTLDGVRVIAEVVEHGRAKKIIVYKQKSKTRYRRKRGHRQGYTRLSIRQIVTGTEEAANETAKPKRPTRGTRRAPKAMDAAEAPVEAPAAEASAPEPAAEAKPTRRTRSRKAPVRVEAPEATGSAPEPAAPPKPTRRTRALKAPTSEEPDTSTKPDEKAESD